jgi:hypothetical protein
MSNPFNFGNPVPPDRMVGRWGQLKAITNDLINDGGHSHIIVGGHRFGKSSFLESLQYFLLKQLDQRKSGEVYVFPVLINLQRLKKNSPEAVFGLILNSIHKCFDPRYAHRSMGVYFDVKLKDTRLHAFMENKQNECDLDDFSEITDELLGAFLNAYGLLRLVFLIDEIEVGLDKEWTEMFFGQLRSLINEGLLRYHIRYVIAGSSRVIDVREQGSPLLNMLKISYLETLAEKDILQIINWVDDVSPEVTTAVIQQCGGHPFVAQYLMHYLWEDGVSLATAASVSELAKKFIHERHADLENWLIAIGKAGQLTYKFLVESNRWLTEVQVQQLVNNPALKIGPALVSLCYHGLVTQDGTWSTYHSVGELFKSWFKNEILPSLQDSEPPARITLPHLQATVPLYSDRSLQDNYGKQHTFQSRGDSQTSALRADPKHLRTSAFICYSHRDRRFLEELHIHLAPYVRTGIVEYWDDTKILPGSKWREEIEKAIQSTKIAVLLISADFLASDFIVNSELPLLLSAARQEGASILCVILRSCAFKNTELSQFQAVNAPSNPLRKMTPGRREIVWAKVAELVQNALQTPSGF